MGKNAAVFLSLFAFCLTVFSGTSQSYRFDQLSVEQGLSQNTVNSILKDSRGYLWVGTNDGLNCYDGYRFQVYRKKSGDSTSLSDNKIYAVLEDRFGKLWVGTRNGLNCYDRKSNRFQRFFHRPEEEGSLSNNFVRTIYEDSDGRIWIGTLGGGLNLWQPEQGNFRRFRLACDNASAAAVNDVSSILEDRCGAFWLGTGAHGVVRLERHSGKAEFLPFGTKEEKDKVLGKKLYEDHLDRLWVGTQGDGVYVLDEERHLIRHFSKAGKGLQHDVVKDIIEHQDGNIWLATDGGGLHIYSPDLRYISQVNYQPHQYQSLASNAVYTFYKDPEGILWIGTFDGGMSIDNPNRKKFRYVTVSTEEGQGLSHRSVLCFLEDKKGNIWIGTDGGGLNRLNRKTENFDYFRSPESGLSSNAITALFEDRKGRIWIGAYMGGLQCLEPGRGIVATYRKETDDQQSIRNDNVWAILEDSRGRFWIGTLGGLDLFDPDKGEFRHIQTENFEPGEYLERITALYEDRLGRIWVGGKGARFYNEKSGKLNVLAEEGAQSLQSVDVRSYHQDQNGNFWISSEGAGLFCLDRQGKMHNFTERDGLPSNAVHTILEDQRGHLWLSTNNGLSRVEASRLLDEKGRDKHQVFRNFCKKDGLQSNQFSYAAALKSRSGELFYGGINGFNYFFPQSIRDNPFKPPVEISGLKIFDQYVEVGEENSPLDRPLSELQHLTLTYQQSLVFSLEFTALNYTSTDKNQYAYILEGFMDDWSHIGTQRTVTFTNLNPGTYRFRVRASNNDGVWNEDGASLQLTILPPFWKSNWAYGLYVWMFLLVLFALRHTLLIRERMKNDLRIKDLEKKKSEELNQMKLAFFTNISHEFRTPLTLIIAPIEQLLARGELQPEVKSRLNLVQRNTIRLQRLINELLEFRKVDDKQETLRLQNVDLVELTRTTKEAFNNLAESRGIDYRFCSHLSELWTMVDPDKLEKVLYNLLSNAFKFTNGMVELTLRGREDQPGSGRFSHVEILVCDNGQGIAPRDADRVFERFYQAGSPRRALHSSASEGTGIGLAYAKSLVEMHEGKIILESEEGKGCRFMVRLPLGLTPAEPKVQEIGQQENPKFYADWPEQGSTGSSSSGFPVSTELDKLPVLLIVEDNADVRDFIRSTFGNSFQVLEAADGEEGAELAFEYLPDIILSDIMMPRKDGISLCRQLKTDDRTSHIPMILLTANTNEERWIDGLETLADDYVTKPFRLRILEARVYNLIRGRELLKKRFSRDLLHPGPLNIESADEAFLRKAIGIIEQHMDDTDFDVGQFAHVLGMSRSLLYRKFSALTDQPVKEFINMIRMKRAAQLLMSGANLSVAEVAFAVGFNDAQYFSKKFKKLYGQTPSQFAEKQDRQAIK